MNAKEWLATMQKAQDFPKGMEKLIVYYGEMLLEESGITDRSKCEAGCKTYTGGEVKHHKDCVYYPDSMSEQLAELQAENNQLTLLNRNLDDALTELQMKTDDGRLANTPLISLHDEMPDITKVGTKVLLYRIMNPDQREMAFSIHDTQKVKYCDPDETWWMPLPNPTKI